MVQPLLQGVELTPGQMAELRAIDTLYYSRLADAEAPEDRTLDDLVLARVREMLRDDQRVRFDRNRAARGIAEVDAGARRERRG